MMPYTAMHLQPACSSMECETMLSLVHVDQSSFQGPAYLALDAAVAH